MIQSCFTMLIFTIIVSFNALAVDGLCSSSNHVDSFSIPITETAGSDIFQYKFRYLKGQPGEPVVIFLPGGPGQNSIGTGDPRYNPSYGYIQTDPRGIGCNDDVRIPLRAIGTETIAKDILHLIQHLKLENYILYGVSYGTLLATKIAFETERAGLTPPRALVLEGVLGKSFSPGEVDINYAKAWERVKVLLSDDVRQSLTAAPLPFEISSRQWAIWIKGMLNFGRIPKSAFSLSSVLHMLHGSEFEKESLRKMVAESSAPSSRELEVYKQIACREIYGEDFWSTLVNGNITPDIAGGNLCDGIRLEQPVDVRLWPFKGPIYYFSGNLDPATPTYMAKYHFENQPLAKKFFVDVQDGGHNSLKVNLSDCAEIIWSEIFQVKNLQIALSNCELTTTLRVSP